MSEYDINQDGKVSESEFGIFKQKIDTQRRLADVAMGSIVVTTGILLTPLVSIERINALSDVISMFYMATAGIIAAFYGVAAWMGKK